MNTDSDATSPSHQANTRRQYADGVRGQHVYFEVVGETSDVAYARARELGVTVLDVRRLREPPELVTEEKTFPDPEHEGETIKMQVPLEKQPVIYRAIGNEEADEKRRARHKNMPVLVEETFTFVVKASWPKSGTAVA